MLFRQIPALLLLLLAATALAAPKSKSKNKHGYGQPTAHCEVEKSKNGVRDIYSMRGNNWNVTSAQLKAGLETPGTMVTGWEFKEAINVDDVHTFKAKVRLLWYSFSPSFVGNFVDVGLGADMFVLLVQVADQREEGDSEEIGGAC